MGCIKAANNFVTVDDGESRKVGVVFEELEFDSRKTSQRGRTMVHNIPSFGVPEIFAHAFESIIMLTVWIAREMRQKTDGVANVETANDVGKN